MIDQLPEFIIYQCQNDSCRFRFPIALTDAHPVPGLYCPKCGGMTRAVEPAYGNYKQQVAMPAPTGPAVEALLDNIRSTYNVGAMFRTADGAGLRHLHLSGVTPTPTNAKVGKTALGAETAVPWSYHLNGLEAALQLKEKGFRLWVLESRPMAESLFAVAQALAGPPVLLVVGNEISGVDPGLLQACDKVLAIPMMGQKRSLNVAIAFGITAYMLRFGI